MLRLELVFVDDDRGDPSGARSYRATEGKEAAMGQRPRTQARISIP